MNRAALLNRLAATERHIAVGEQHLLRQREIVGELERHGRGNSVTAKLARELLQTYETAQAAHVAGRERLMEALQAS